MARLAWCVAALLARCVAYDWDDDSVDAFDCDSYVLPLQMLIPEDEDSYGVRELDIDTGEYGTIYDLDWFDGHVNAVGMYEDEASGEFYPFGSFAGQLCRFDDSHASCFDAALEYASSNVGAVLETTYYYSKNSGRDGGEKVFFVQDIDTDDPTFVQDALFEFSGDLFEGAVLDVVALHEGWEQDHYVLDGDNGARYLVGLGQAFEVVVIHIDADSGYPDKYAVLDSVVVDWGDADRVDEPSAFGAAYRFEAGDDDRVFFSANAGFGMFELHWPIVVASDCWNSGDDWENHAACDGVASPKLAYIGPSEVTSSNDGFNCPDGYFATTGAPTAYDEVTPFDCDA
ncbi:DNA binding protein [Aureococcus anophagefferens]|nr:DNA binding protein [Aureococcus anophagefferens]